MTTGVGQKLLELVTIRLTPPLISNSKRALALDYLHDYLPLSEGTSSSACASLVGFLSSHNADLMNERVSPNHPIAAARAGIDGSVTIEATDKCQDSRA